MNLGRCIMGSPFRSEVIRDWQIITSNIGASTIRRTCCTILSVSAGIPKGRDPPGFGISTDALTMADTCLL